MRLKAPRVIACQWDGCERSATYHGLSHGLALCSMHFPEHLSLLQDSLNRVVGDIHKAFDAISDIAYNAADLADSKRENA